MILVRYMVIQPKMALAGKRQHTRSHSNTHFGGQVWAECGQNVGTNLTVRVDEVASAIAPYSCVAPGSRDLSADRHELARPTLSDSPHGSAAPFCS
jgi:hypothetical protein